MSTERVSVQVERLEQGRFRATNTDGSMIEVGRAEGLFTPVELLLAALGACSSIDPDAVASRRTEPQSFTAQVSADYVRDDENYLQNLLLELAVVLDDDAADPKTIRVIERALASAHQKTCTVARTLERNTTVRATSNVTSAS